MGTEDPHPDTDLLVFAREGDARACFLLCETHEPDNIDVLLGLLAPDGVVTAKVFNGAADGYDLWREAVAIEATKTRDHPEAPLAAAA